MSDNWTSIRAAAAPETDGNEEAHKIEGCWVIRHTAAGLPTGGITSSPRKVRAGLEAPERRLALTILDGNPVRKR